MALGWASGADATRPPPGRGGGTGPGGRGGAAHPGGRDERARTSAEDEQGGEAGAEGAAELVAEGDRPIAVGRCASVPADAACTESVALAPVAVNAAAPAASSSSVPDEANAAVSAAATPTVTSTARTAVRPRRAAPAASSQDAADAVSSVTNCPVPIAPVVQPARSASSRGTVNSSVKYEVDSVAPSTAEVTKSGERSSRAGTKPSGRRRMCAASSTAATRAPASAGSGAVGSRISAVASAMRAAAPRASNRPGAGGVRVTCRATPGTARRATAETARASRHDTASVSVAPSSGPAAPSTPKPELMTPMRRVLPARFIARATRPAPPRDCAARPARATGSQGAAATSAVPPITRPVLSRSTGTGPRRRSSPARSGVPATMAQAKAVTSQVAVAVETPRERAMSGRIRTGAFAPAATGAASSASQAMGTGARPEPVPGLGPDPGRAAAASAAVRTPRVAADPDPVAVDADVADMKTP